MVFFVVKLLNYFPAKGGVLSQYSPKTIMSGERINYKHYCLPFGTYCQVHEEDSLHNSLAAQMQGAISLGPSTNKQGGQHFYTLTTAKAVTRQSWHVILMPSTVIARVNKLANDQPQRLTFYDRAGREIGDADAEHYTADDAQYETPGVVADDVELPGVDTDSDSPKSNDNYDPDTPPDTDETPLLLEPTENTSTEINKSAENNDAVEFEPTTEPAQPIARTSRTATPAKEKPAATHTSNKGTCRSTRECNKPLSYQPSMKGKSYQYAATQLAQLESKQDDIDDRVVGIIMTQLTLKVAIKMWGNEAKIVAAESEMKQLHWRNSSRPVKWSELNDKQKTTILESHIFMKMKRTGKIKGRTVARGNKQEGTLTKRSQVPLQLPPSRSYSPPWLTRSKREKWRSLTCSMLSSRQWWKMRRSTSSFAYEEC